MKFGISDEQYRLLDDLVLQPLKSLGAEVFIFGSRVTGTHHPYSDVDILYRLPSTTAVPMGRIAILKESIEESRFPFAVDLVNENDLADNYRKSVLAEMRQV